MLSQEKESIELLETLAQRTVEASRPPYIPPGRGVLKDALEEGTQGSGAAVSSGRAQVSAPFAVAAGGGGGGGMSPMRHTPTPPPPPEEGGEKLNERWVPSPPISSTTLKS